ncbi:DUF2460 domain-containing protein [Maricaulis virginensis]|uniref:Glycoside hydrolase family 24 n=1 Tax=Maricaulis virginensis TaxID=144022 RepID=A0A9W6IIS9_9PROT|nr:DUF2460 domain-containing protein [Maricaulis virginensis]GLK50708.1 glycoside hydrolase family 24 [Maricaulis virginensis]
MSAFHEIRFPFAIGLGASGGPERRTEIVTLVSGREERNSPWANSRRRWDAGPGIASLDDIHTLLAFFEARQGRLHGFRFRDPLDNRSCAPSVQPSPADQVLGTGDGGTAAFQLVKHYASGAQSWTRTIAKPVEGSVRAAIDGVETPVTTDHTTGLIIFDTPPAPGAVITAGFAFDCPVRFDTDRLDIALDTIGAGAVPHVPLVELI